MHATKRHRLGASLSSSGSAIIRDIREATHDTAPAAEYSPAVLGCSLRRRLPACTLGKRWAAIDSASGEAALIYQLDPKHLQRTAADALTDMLRAGSLGHPHVMRVRRGEVARDASVHLVADYPGTRRGLKSVADLAGQKTTGVFEPGEARAAAEHALGALTHAHAAGFAHGWLRIDEALVDPRGRIVLELFGVARALLTDPPPIEDARRADVRSVAAILHEMLTGLPAGVDRVPLSRAVGRSARAWDVWIHRGLADGFEDAATALRCLPAR